MFQKVFLLLFGSLLCCQFAFAGLKILDDEGLTQKMVEVSNQKYFEKARLLIKEAKESVSFSMFMVMPASAEVLALIADVDVALARGVSVKIYVNTRYTLDGWVYLTKHYYGVDRTKLQIFPLAENHFLFQKLIIIDKRYLLEGSVNWSKDSLKENFEFAILIDSPDLANERAQFLESLPHANDRQGKGYLQWRSVLRGVAKEKVLMDIPTRLLTDRKYFNHMLENNNDCLNAYLLLNSARTLSGEDVFEVDLDALAQGLNLPKAASQKLKTKRINSVLKDLEKQYKLLNVKSRSNNSILINMKTIDEDFYQVPVDIGTLEFVSRSPVEFKTAYLVYAFFNKIYSEAEASKCLKYLEQLSQCSRFKKYAICAVPPILK